MDSVKTRSFDFSEESNKAELKKWKDAVRAIPFPKKDFWIDGIDLDEEERAETTFTATYQYLDIDPDTWFWKTVYFKKDGTATVGFMCGYSTQDEDRLTPIVNRSLIAVGFEETDDISNPAWKELSSWQEGYDLLCNVAERTKLPLFQNK